MLGKVLRKEYFSMRISGKRNTLKENIILQVLSNGPIELLINRGRTSQQNFEKARKG